MKSIVTVYRDVSKNGKYFTFHSNYQSLYSLDYLFHKRNYAQVLMKYHTIMMYN